MAKAPHSDLTDKREAFIRAYVGEARFNGTEAARLAKFADPGKTAYQLLKNPHVRARIDEILATQALSANAVLAELAAVASAEWRDFTETRRSPRGDEYEVMDLSAKVKSLELLGKAHKLFTDKIEASGPNSGPIVFDVRVTDAPHADGE